MRKHSIRNRQAHSIQIKTRCRLRPQRRDGRYDLDLTFDPIDDMNESGGKQEKNRGQAVPRIGEIGSSGKEA